MNTLFIIGLILSIVALVAVLKLCYDEYVQRRDADDDIDWYDL